MCTLHAPGAAAAGTTSALCACVGPCLPAPPSAPGERLLLRSDRASLCHPFALYSANTSYVRRPHSAASDSKNKRAPAPAPTVSDQHWNTLTSLSSCSSLLPALPRFLPLPHFERLARNGRVYIAPNCPLAHCSLRCAPFDARWRSDVHCQQARRVSGHACRPRTHTASQRSCTLPAIGTNVN